MPKHVKIATAPLSALRAFEAAARHGSFKLAAGELSVTPAAISHQLAHLEDYLACPLFIRKNRFVQLTPAGETLAKHVSASFLQLQLAMTQAAASEASNTSLVVSSAPSLAVKWLVPRLHRFHAKHPEIDIRLSSENQQHDLIRDSSVDIVLRYGKGNYTGVHAERIWEKTFVFPVCSPNTLAKAKPPIHQLKDLHNQTLLRLPLPPHQTTGVVGERWQAWLDALAYPEQSLYQTAAKGPFYSHEHLAIDTAKSGHGFSLALDVLVIEDLLAKQLVRPFTEQIQDPYSHWLIYREKDKNKNNVKAFAEWIRQEARLTEETLSTCRHPS